MQLFYQKDISSDEITLSPEESRHLTKVLRKSSGDEVHITDGIGHLYTCKVTTASPKETTLNVLHKESTLPSSHHIHLAIAPTKNTDRMEWMLEKITEIGFQELSFIKTANSERNFLKPDRLEKKMVAACKQSLKTHFPVVNPLITFEELLADDAYKDHQKFIAYVDENNTQHLFDLAEKNGSYLVLIGPEGDFSPEEINAAFQRGAKACSLGHSRLRTETAGLTAVHTLSLKNF